MKIELIFNSNTKIKILRVLISTYTAYSLYELRDMTYSSIGAIYLSLLDLKSENIVDEIKGKGKQSFYKINKNCPVEIINLFEKEKIEYKILSVNVRNMLSDILLDLKKIKVIEEISLFGSYARGEQRPSSDIDILIISKNKIEFNKERYLKKYKINISFINILSDEYKIMEDKKSELYIELLKGKINLFKR